LLEVGAAILFFGSLAQNPDLQRSGVRALEELRELEYTIPNSLDPVRVYPAATGGDFGSAHAGGWRPGVISLRENPLGNVGAETFLRHELAHEAVFRTCGGRLPLWAEEAAAMSFSGELSGGTITERVDEGDVELLRRRIRIGANLDSTSYGALFRLVAAQGWPSTPCEVSKDVERLLAPTDGWGGSGFSAILIHVASGRVLETRGDQKTRCPPGSLLKIPYAAALKNPPRQELGRELARSDTEGLMHRRSGLDLDRYRFLISSIEGADLGKRLPPEELAGKDERFWRRYLGERDENGRFPLEASLPELASMLRSCLLNCPDCFAELAQNGFLERSTLHRAAESDKQVLARLRALSKTGTVSDDRGNPLVGHLMVAWPAESPSFLALFRNEGSTGGSTLRHASAILGEWSRTHPIAYSLVKVRLLSLLPRDSWEILDECPSFERKLPEGAKERVSTCGRFRILASARGSRSERLVAGTLTRSADDQLVVLQTDPDSYAEAVISAEAQGLPAEARKALHAVVVWNGVHGWGRHPETGAVCDSTHCMVFRGVLPDQTSELQDRCDAMLLMKLDEIAGSRRMDWLPFSRGGDEVWAKQVSPHELRKQVDEPTVLDLRRERTRSGSVTIHLLYQESEEMVPCEAFRNRLKLPSCPDVIARDADSGAWIFRGVGAGHGEGLSVERAKALAQSGRNALDILRDAYEVWQTGASR
jgi:hypothetical protein